MTIILGLNGERESVSASDKTTHTFFVLIAAAAILYFAGPADEITVAGAFVVAITSAIIEQLKNI